MSTNELRLNGINLNGSYVLLKDCYQNESKLAAINYLRKLNRGSGITLMDWKYYVEKLADDFNWIPPSGLSQLPVPVLSHSPFEIRRMRKNAERAIKHIQSIGGTVSNVDTKTLREKELEECIEFIKVDIQPNSNRLRQLSSMLRTFSKE